MEDQKSQNPTQKSAQKYFAKSAQDETLAKQVRKKERTVTAAKTARLRALRLAKEAADKQEVDRLAARKTAAAASGRRERAPVPKDKPAKLVRMIY